MKRHRRFSRSRRPNKYSPRQVSSYDAHYRVGWPGVGQIEGYYATLGDAVQARDSSIEYDIQHRQGGPHAVVQRYEGDGEWWTMRPQPKGRELR